MGKRNLSSLCGRRVITPSQRKAGETKISASSFARVDHVGQGRKGRRRRRGRRRARKREMFRLRRRFLR